MARILMGYPGSGLSTWVKQQPDESKPIWQTEFDASAVAGDAVVCIQYSYDNMQAVAAAGLGVTMLYPAPECIPEYYDRMIEEGVEEADAQLFAATIDSDLRDLRESENPNEHHVILGRGEYCYDRL
ncbi:hypothetical protein pEaSNUABM54_00214 [Erwinia phage pEa_SNUABM_54]|nr:hypothetical protein pEaSNUABM54_00214 [Erwinia phage pEa_SNUABM_54]